MNALVEENPAASGRLGVSMAEVAEVADLEAKVDALRRPATYRAFLEGPEGPEAPARVVAIETHMSWVFLTDRFAYKLKKPVRLDFVDFSTLDLRLQDARDEVRLNRRLAPTVYLGIVPLTSDPRDGLRLGGQGAVVDWLVQMRRLPAERMLDQVIRSRTLAQSEIRRVARLLARFYRSAPAVEMPPGAYHRALESEARATEDELAAPDYGLLPDQVRQTGAAQLRFVADQAELLARRVAEGRIVEGHGDLRPEHVCLERPPVVIDCLEFNLGFRCLDVVDELAFLAMECERLGEPRVGRVTFAVYGRTVGDHPPAALVSFYKCRRACLRAKLSARHTRDPAIADPARWRAQAAGYLALAATYARDLGTG